MPRTRRSGAWWTTRQLGSTHSREAVKGGARLVTSSREGLRGVDQLTEFLFFVGSQVELVELVGPEATKGCTRLCDEWRRLHCAHSVWPSRCQSHSARADRAHKTAAHRCHRTHAARTRAPPSPHSARPAWSPDAQKIKSGRLRAEIVSSVLAPPALHTRSPQGCAL